MKRLRIANRKGSVLVLVTLVTLVLAALVIVSLRNIARTVRQAAVHQTRTQSIQVSRSANAVVSKRVGDKAPLVYNRMVQRMYTVEAASSDSGVLGGSRDLSARKDMIRAGQWTKFQSDEFDFLSGTTSNTGLFTEDNTKKSFEDKNGHQTSFRTIVRDPMDAQAASGFDRNFCFKKVTIVSEATVGARRCTADVDCDTGQICRGNVAGVEKGFCDDNWGKLNTISQSRSGIEGLIGPVECGYQ